MKNNTLPQQVHLAPGALAQLPALLRQQGKKVLLVHGHRPVEDGLLAKVRVLLDKAGFPSANMGQILPNPKYGSVKRGIEIARKENCDIILALGGGSTLQCAKAIALGLGYKGDVWDFWKGKKKPKHVYPVASILTNPSSASELSENCTIVRKGKQKTIHLPQLVCKFAILDPELSMYPLYPTMNQIFGIFEHLFLAYLEQDPPKTKEAALLLKDLRKCSDALAKNINDVEARTELYRVGLLSHSQIGSVKSPFEGLTDRLAFASSLPEGSAGSALFAAWCDGLSDQEKERIAQLGMDMFDFSKPSYKKTIEKLTQWFEKMGLPQSLQEAGLSLNKKILKQVPKDKHQEKVLEKAQFDVKKKKDKKEKDKKPPLEKGPKGKTGAKKETPTPSTPPLKPAKPLKPEAPKSSFLRPTKDTPSLSLKEIDKPAPALKAPTSSLDSTSKTEPTLKEPQLEDKDDKKEDHKKPDHDHKHEHDHDKDHEKHDHDHSKDQDKEEPSVKTNSSLNENLPKEEEKKEEKETTSKEESSNPTKPSPNPIPTLEMSQPLEDETKNGE